MKLSKAVEDFLTDCRTQRGLARRRKA